MPTVITESSENTCRAGEFAQWCPRTRRAPADGRVAVGRLGELLVHFPGLSRSGKATEQQHEIAPQIPCWSTGMVNNGVVSPMIQVKPSGANARDQRERQPVGAPSPAA